MSTARSISSVAKLKMTLSHLATASAADPILSVNASNAPTSKSVGLLATTASRGLLRRNVPKRQSCRKMTSFGKKHFRLRHRSAEPEDCSPQSSPFVQAPRQRDETRHFGTQGECSSHLSSLSRQQRHAQLCLRNLLPGMSHLD